MKCPNCGSKIYDGDKFCGECGFSLEKTETLNSELTNEKITNHSIHNELLNGKVREDTFRQKDDTIMPENSSSQQQTETTHPNGVGVYFKEVWNYVKSVFVSPDKLIASRVSYKFATTLGTLGLITLLVSFLTTLFASKIANTLAIYAYDIFTIDVPIIGTTVSIFLALIILLAAFYGLTILLAKVIGRNLKPKEIFTDYATTSIIMFAISILGLLFGFIGIPKLFGILVFISFGLFMFAPLYILLRNTENHNDKFDKFYTSAIYFFVSVIVLILVLSIIDSLFGNNVGDILDTLSILELLSF